MLFRNAVIVLLFILPPLLTHGQNRKNYCTLIDSTKLIVVDSGSNWTFGTPTKTFLNGNFSGDTSIVTSLDSNYQSNDTSTFFYILDDIPNYLGLFLGLDIYFSHRFQLDSNDFGEISISINNGETWHNVMGIPSSSNDPNQIPYHVFESTGDTLLDSLEIKGNSNGWVHSRLVVDLNWYFWNDQVFVIDNANAIIKFSLYSDSSGTAEGWQIDSLCAGIDIITGIAETNHEEVFRLSPNPTKGKFVITRETSSDATLRIITLTGNIVFEEPFSESKTSFKVDLPSGIYVVIIQDEKKTQSRKLYIQQPD